MLYLIEVQNLIKRSLSTEIKTTRAIRIHNGVHYTGKIDWIPINRDLPELERTPSMNTSSMSKRQSPRNFTISKDVVFEHLDTLQHLEEEEINRLIDSCSNEGMDTEDKGLFLYITLIVLFGVDIADSRMQRFISSLVPFYLTKASQTPKSTPLLERLKKQIAQFKAINLIN